jgi:hypothetical protein
MKPTFIIVLLLVSIKSFAQQGRNDPYTGQSKTQIMQWFGQPETKDSNASRQILTYHRVYKFNSEHLPMPTGNPTIDENFGKVKRIERFTFTFNQKGVVRSWQIDTLR